MRWCSLNYHRVVEAMVKICRKRGSNPAIVHNPRQRAIALTRLDPTTDDVLEELSLVGADPK